jgi:hypothetical protein
MLEGVFSVPTALTVKCFVFWGVMLWSGEITSVSEKHGMKRVKKNFSLNLKMEAVLFSEMFVNFCQTIQHHISERKTLQSLLLTISRLLY